MRVLFYTAESPLLWPKVGDCTVIADPINSSFIPCRDVNFGNKPQTLRYADVPGDLLRKFLF